MPVRHSAVCPDAVCCAETAPSSDVAAIERAVESPSKTDPRPCFGEFAFVAKIRGGATGGEENRKPESDGPGPTAQEGPA